MYRIFIQYEVNYKGEYLEEQIYVLYVLHGLSVFLVMTTVAKYKFQLALLKMRYKLMEDETLISSRKLPQIMLECLVCLLHPQYFLHCTVD